VGIPVDVVGMAPTPLLIGIQRLYKILEQVQLFFIHGIEQA